MALIKKRLDVFLLELGFVSTREKARAIILAGDVLVDDQPCTKAGFLVKENSKVRIRGEINKFVSRGGDKLEGALIDLNLEVLNLICLDVGSSTGGFTDCLLQKGASLVYAIDVGTNQLDYKLRTDPRVIIYEQTHVKDIAKLNFNEKVKFAVIDVSFIGLKKVLPFIIPVLDENASILMLVKPQFELGPEFITKKGVPLDSVNPYLAVEKLKLEFSSLGLKLISEIPSRVKGKKSDNQEYFVLVSLLKEHVF